VSEGLLVTPPLFFILKGGKALRLHALSQSEWLSVSAGVHMSGRRRERRTLEQFHSDINLYSKERIAAMFDF